MACYFSLFPMKQNQWEIMQNLNAHNFGNVRLTNLL